MVTKKRLTELEEKEKELDTINKNAATPNENEGLKKEDLTGDGDSNEVHEATCDKCGYEIAYRNNPPISCPNCQEKFE